ncbi:putative LRR receptor-like serine/threonine-protein kinase EFR-like [Capsicum annuum]|nr:putative LRR receptor-like serine/threonine-protein kinase EFR-like [Capsicum annuum]
MSGNIPKSLEKLQNLKYFNISVNKLYGEIPSGGPFKNLSSQFFIYNEALCGSSRFSVPPCPTSSKHRSNRKEIASSFSFAENCSSSSTDALSESSLIGSGSFGSVYKGILRNRTAIAVKVFNLQLDAAFKSFDTESEVLRNLRHRNLVKRLRIMIDVACALEYLHHGCSLPVIHCDVKPSNVLLDEDMVAHLSDFGISKLLGEDQGDLYTKALATLGYIALEYGLDGLVSTKCDVYSYGIMLLETFTRRKLNEFDGDLSLKQWASYSLPEAVMDVVDVNLVTPQGNHKELDVVALIMKVALDCCAESPARRTNMKDVVGMLQKIKIQLFAC